MRDLHAEVERPAGMRGSVRRTAAEVAGTATAYAPHREAVWEVVKVGPELDLVPGVGLDAVSLLPFPLDQNSEPSCPAFKVGRVALRGRAVGRDSGKVLDEDENSTGKVGRVDFRRPRSAVDPRSLGVEAVRTDRDFEAGHRGGQLDSGREEERSVATAAAHSGLQYVVKPKRRNDEQFGLNWCRSSRRNRRP